VQIRVPVFLAKAGILFFRWGDRPLWRRRRFVARRIDLVLVIAGVICTAYYGWTTGWLGALTGALAFTFILMIALWL